MKRLLLVFALCGVALGTKPSRCPQNEKYYTCKPTCPAEPTCRRFFNPVGVICAVPPHDAPCEPGCLCSDGFVRNQNGICVKPEDCCVKNAEVVDCPNSGQPSCNSPTESRTLKLCFGNRGCQCKKGFLWNNGQCVQSCKCPKPKCTGENEEYVSCLSANCPRTCDHFRRTVRGGACKDTSPCVRGCTCLPNYARDGNGLCVPENECPLQETCGKNQIARFCYKCTIGALSNCDNYIINQPQGCYPFEDPKERCFLQCPCKEGYLWKTNEGCVPKEDCCADPRKIVVSCPNPCPKTCDEPNGPSECNKPCLLRGCTCRDNYLQDKNGNCVLPEECPLKCGKREFLNECPKRCEFEDTCESILEGVVQPCLPPDVEEIYTPRCDCIKGAVRVNKDNESYCADSSICCNDGRARAVKCPVGCQETCDEEMNLNLDCEPENNCDFGKCICKEGFARNVTGQCIDRNGCTKIKTFD